MSNFVVKYILYKPGYAPLQPSMNDCSGSADFCQDPIRSCSKHSCSSNVVMLLRGNLSHSSIGLFTNSTSNSLHFHRISFIFLTRFVNQKLKGLHLRIGIILTFHETINIQLGHYIDDLNLFFGQTAANCSKQ